MALIGRGRRRFPSIVVRQRRQHYQPWLHVPAAAHVSPDAHHGITRIDQGFHGPEPESPNGASALQGGLEGKRPRNPDLKTKATSGEREGKGERESKTERGLMAGFMRGTIRH